MQYQFTQLETDIKHFYDKLRIFSPSDIDMYYIANEMDIWIHYHNDESTLYKSRNGLYSIFLDERLSYQEQWQDFGHELGHVIKHVGNQHKLKPMFRLLQENQANNFMYQFCVPTFMLLDLKVITYMNINDGLTFISKTFNVTHEFARVRLNHFKNQLLLAKSDSEHRAYMAARYPKAGPYMQETLDVLNQLDIIIAKRNGEGKNA